MIVEFHNLDERLGMWAPMLNNDSTIPRDNAVLTASGYGRIGLKDSVPGHLRSVEVPIVPHEKCKQSYSDVDKYDSICAGNEWFDSCKGDSGGPLWTLSSMNASLVILVGAVSYGYGCAAPNAPGVYARISQHVDWINTVLDQPATKYVAPKLYKLRLGIIIGAGVLIGIIVLLVIGVCVYCASKRRPSNKEGH